VTTPAEHYYLVPAQIIPPGFLAFRRNCGDHPIEFLGSTEMLPVLVKVLVALELLCLLRSTAHCPGHLPVWADYRHAQGGRAEHNPVLQSALSLRTD